MHTNTESSTMPRLSTMDSLNTGGRLARRLIEDWYRGALQHANWSEPRLQSCYHLRGARPGPVGPNDDHDLIMIPSQTHGHQMACLCKHCRYHFVFTWAEPEFSSPGHPQHHFVMAPGDDESFGEEKGKQLLVTWPSRDKKLGPLMRKTSYRCSFCGFSIRLDVSAPRLASRWIDIVTDESRAKRNLKRAMDEDPGRFKDMTQEKLAKLESSALMTLNMYITNIMSNDSTSAEKKISERNKTFMVQFGPECEELFLYLGFTKRQEAEDTFYISPQVPPENGGRTLLYSERSFFENVKSEIQSVIDQKRPELVHQHSPARIKLQTVLGVDDAQTRTVHWKVSESDLHYFYLLGASSKTTEPMLIWAYERQAAVDRDHERYYREAFNFLAYHGDEEMQMYAVHLDQKALPRPEKSEYDKDWEWFGFWRAQGRTLTKDRIIERYKHYRETRPEAGHLHRLHLAKIARDLGQRDLVYIAVVDMDEAEANGVLDSTAQTAPDTIAYAALESVNNNEKDAAVVVTAMNLIGARMARQRRGDKDFDEALGDFETISGQLESLVSGETQNQDFCDPVSNGQEMEVGAGDLTLPVGLDNIRNTCYLNSILQYLYTVDVIRDLLRTLDLDTPEASTDRVGEILSGSVSGVEEGQKKEAFLGHEFARELKTLFHEMEETRYTHVKPRQRLANAAMARADKGGSTAESKATGPKAANSAVPELKITTSTDADAKMVNGEETFELEHVETTSVSSSQTLVGETPAAASTGSGKKMEKAGPLEALVKELDQDEVKGTAQQDVDEAMGNILEHLQAALKLARARRNAGEDGSEEIPDPIDDHFYSNFRIYNRTRGNDDVQGWTTHEDRNRMIMAPLHETKAVKEDLYQAIGRGMDVQLNEETNKMTYSVFKRPADILHFLFPRSRALDLKNENPVELNDPLYLDLFMDVVPGDERYGKRTRLWALNKRLEELNTKPRAFEPGSAKILSEEDIDRLVTENGLVDADGDYELVDADERTALATKEVQGGWVAVSPEKLKQFEERQRADDSAELLKEKQGLVVGEVEYRLHAVFCHTGTPRSGHYWVWIKDFERGAWHKYNDELVTVHSEEDFRKQAGTAAEPCWAAYVRADKVAGLVSTPLRKRVRGG
ncbi:ubiquitin-specific protease ubp2 [Podospora pseudoanserina]|uniref:ubiquitinyl hydrolase 1 n=1 Tax=Podospora pseudoanserina TaxID=2609844 RepID=A0ABR0I7K7_9PEZI|nr:ubiquitin-specific protease ubp2 [Podospora pseudoanserina]